MNWTTQSASSITVSLDRSADRPLRLEGNQSEGHLRASAEGKRRFLASNDLNRHCFGEERSFLLLPVDAMKIPEPRKRDPIEVAARHGDDDDIGFKRTHQIVPERQPVLNKALASGIVESAPCRICRQRREQVGVERPSRLAVIEARSHPVEHSLEA